MLMWQLCTFCWSINMWEFCCFTWQSSCMQQNSHCMNWWLHRDRRHWTGHYIITRRGENNKDIDKEMEVLGKLYKPITRVFDKTQVALKELNGLVYHMIEVMASNIWNIHQGFHMIVHIQTALNTVLINLKPACSTEPKWTKTSSFKKKQLQPNCYFLRDFGIFL